MTTTLTTRTRSNPGDPTSAVADLGAAADRRTDELHAGRRIPADLYRDAAEQGLFRQLVVRDFGGLETTPLEWFRAGVELARSEASFGWVVTQGAAQLGWIGAGADTEWAEEVLRDPLAASASSVAGFGSLSMDGDRARFGGRWAVSSGCQGATWIGGLALVDSGIDRRGRPEIRWGWVPAERAEIIEDWDSSGMRDNARRALDEARAILVEKAPAPDFVPLATNAAIQRGLVEAEGLWGAALASVERELASMWDEAVSLYELSIDQRVRLHRANVTANRLSVRVVDQVCDLTGTAAVAQRHVLSRCHRDAHALRGHISTNGASVEHNAKVSLGLSSHHSLV